MNYLKTLCERQWPLISGAPRDNDEGAPEWLRSTGSGLVSALLWKQQRNKTEHFTEQVSSLWVRWFSYLTFRAVNKGTNNNLFLESQSVHINFINHQILYYFHKNMTFLIYGMFTCIINHESFLWPQPLGFSQRQDFTHALNYSSFSHIFYTCSLIFYCCVTL